MKTYPQFFHNELFPDVCSFWGVLLLNLEMWRLLGFFLNVRTLFSFDTARCSLNGEGVWSIGMVTGPSLFNLTTPTGQVGGKLCLKNPIISCFDVDDIPAAFVADPFLFVEDNLASNPWYAFFEVKNMFPSKDLNRRRGQIALAISYNQVFLCYLLLHSATVGKNLEISECCLCE
jgi:hypothetical protein